MAFSPDGMFYLGKEDLAPTIDSAGTGIRSMFGLQNKKEAVDSILQSGDFSTPKSRQAVLEQIRAVDSEAYYKYAKLENEKLAADQKMQHSTDKPLIKQRWNLEGKPNAMIGWATTNLSGEAGYDDFIKNLGTANAEFATHKFINGIKDKDSKAAYKKTFKSYMDNEEDNYMTTWLRAGVSSDEYSGSFDKKDLTLETDDGGSDTVTPPVPFNPSKSAVSQGIVNESASYDTQQKQQRAINKNTAIRTRDMFQKITSLRKDPDIFKIERSLDSATLENENKIDEVIDWMQGIARDDFIYFKGKEKELTAFEKDPLGWYFSNINKTGKKKGTTEPFSKYSFWGN